MPIFNFQISLKKKIDQGTGLVAKSQENGSGSWVGEGEKTQSRLSRAASVGKSEEVGAAEDENYTKLRHTRYAMDSSSIRA